MDDDQDTRCGRMLSGLLEASHLMPLEDLPAAVNEYARGAGFTRVLVYLADVQREALQLLTRDDPTTDPDTASAETRMRIDGTVAGRTYQLGKVLSATPNDPARGPWWVPLVDGVERLGVLQVSTEATGEHRRTRQDVHALAALIALLVASKRSTSDFHARLTRTRPMDIAAEMQWHLMPPATYADGRVVVSGVMEPAYRISGDAFDYALAGPVLHLSLFDAMGHDTAAGITANLAMGACRATRRRGATLIELGEAVENAIVEQFGTTRYATGILADLDTDTGVLTWINRGHHPPVIIRGGRWITLLHCPPGHPMGTALGLETTLCREQLQRGDRLVLYTDGITEARRPGGPEFGLHRFLDFLVRHHADGLPVPETLRRLVRAVMDHHHGHLGDDATVLLCEWIGPGSRPDPEVAALVGLPR
ncbi:PP2C family protein-serine/threonine phosphatase [Embleya sp. MST-111070]|uniref:PP2C family protein-serine/threonine phosphatase n=1 Tax=Embleya sp. MST-111070 TaxID=3398231 RepID=UPI003F734710